MMVTRTRLFRKSGSWPTPVEKSAGGVVLYDGDTVVPFGQACWCPAAAPVELSPRHFTVIV
jgi:hypothetical protein